MLYPKRLTEVEIAAPLLEVMGITVIFVCVCASCHSFLQGIGKERLPLFFMLGGACVKLIMNFIFVAVPSLNIKAAPYGSLVCYIIIMIADIWAINHFGGIRINIYAIFIKTVFAGGLCALGAKLTYAGAQLFGLSSNVSTVAAILVAVIVYVFAVLMTKAITKKDFLMLPKGEKIAEILEKLHLLR